MQYKNIEPTMFVSDNALFSGLDFGGLRIHKNVSSTPNSGNDTKSITPILPLATPR